MDLGNNAERWGRRGMNTGEVKGFSMRKELPTGKREPGHPKERRIEKREGPHMKESGG